MNPTLQVAKHAAIGQGLGLIAALCGMAKRSFLGHLTGESARAAAFWFERGCAGLTSAPLGQNISSPQHKWHNTQPHSSKQPWAGKNVPKSHQSHLRANLRRALGQTRRYMRTAAHTCCHIPGAPRPLYHCRLGCATQLCIPPGQGCNEARVD